MAEQIYTEINKFNTTPKLKEIERFPFLLISFSFSLNSLQHIYKSIRKGHIKKIHDSKNTTE